MIAPESWIAAALVAASFGLFALRIAVAASDAPGSWAVRSLTDPQAVAILCGAMLGWAAPEWLARPFGLVLLPGLAFFAGWMGVAAGCGLDLRTIKGGHVTGFLFEAAVASATVLALFSLSLLGEMIAGVPNLGAPALFVLAAVCVAGPAMPAPGVRGSRVGRSRGMGSGLRTPSILAVIAVLLAAVGMGLGSSEPVPLALPGLVGSHPLPIQLEGLVERLLWGFAAGCLAGFLADMATRVDFAPRGLYPPLAAVVLLAVGLSGGIGLEGLLVGAVAGFWLINATLRRLDILRVLDRGAKFPRVAVPFLAAWYVGAGLRQGSMDAVVFAVVAAGVVALRPVVRLATARAVEGAFGRRRRRGPKPSAAEGLSIDEFGLVIGVLLLKPLQPTAGVGGLAGVLAAALALGVVRNWWRQGARAEGRAPGDRQPADQPNPARSSGPG